MEEMVLVAAVLGVGYVLGVWTACVVFGQPQRDYEDGSTRTSAATSKVTIGSPAGRSRPPRGRL
ncbi:MAG TPA: hypothetical protein VNF26_10390 [Candidatus Baltobacterales bacterium]|nr:hypothetical protein [Candidatus Baltobacterales bacterium]